MKSSSTQAHQAIWDDVKGQVMRFLKFLLTKTGQAKHKTPRMAFSSSYKQEQEGKPLK